MAMVAARPSPGDLGAATVEFHERIASTSDRARELLREGAALPAVVVAERQWRGRGRRGRRWESDTAGGLWFTLVRGDIPPAADPVLPLRVGLALARTLEALLSEQARALPQAPNPPTPPLPPPPLLQVKWPNDLLTGGAKVAGILCERLRGAVLVGIGVNLNQRAWELPAGLTPPATSLGLAFGCVLAKEPALTAIMRELRGLWSRPGRGIPPAELIELNARSALRGVSLSVTGAVRTPAGKLREVTGLSATGGSLHADGTLEILKEPGVPLRLVAGSATPAVFISSPRSGSSSRSDSTPAPP